MADLLEIFISWCEGNLLMQPNTLGYKAMLLSSLPNQWYCGCSWYQNGPQAMLSISFPQVFCHMCSMMSFKNNCVPRETLGVPSLSLDSSLIWPQQVVWPKLFDMFAKIIFRGSLDSIKTPVKM